MSNKGINTTLALGLGAALFVSVNMVAGAGLRGVKVDLTEQNLYTLSDGTKALLKKLEEPIKLRLYFSKGVIEDVRPDLVDYSDRIREMLESYVDVAGANLSLEVIDPEPFSEAEDRAVSFGIQGVPVSVAGDNFYFGLVGTNLVDDEETIPVLDPGQEARLEYQLTELIDRLANPELPVVGVISSFPLSGGMQPGPMGQPQQSEPWAIMDLLERGYDARMLDGATLTEIPEDVTTLLMIHPKGLSPEALYVIDQWALAGGKIVAFVDPFSEMDPERRNMQNPAAAFDAQLASEIDPLLKAWGIDLVPSTVVGDRALAVSVRDRNGVPVPFPPFFDLSGDEASDDDIVTEGIKAVRLMLPGQLRVRDDKPAGVTAEVLLTTTETGGTIDSMRFLPEPDPVAINDTFVDGAAPISLAMRLTGNVVTAFPDGKPTAPEEETLEEESAEGEEAETPEESPEEVAQLTESTAPLNAIVIADADMLHEQMWGQRVRDLFGNVMVRPVFDNASLLVGALDNMTGSSELISLRSRGDYRRPFTRKDELEAEAQDRFREEEERLEAELQKTEEELNQLQAQKDPEQAMFLSPEQEARLADFREKQLDTRKELRDVKRQLRADIDALGTRLKFLNTLVVPLLILVGVGAWSLVRGGRRRS